MDNYNAKIIASATELVSTGLPPTLSGKNVLVKYILEKISNINFLLIEELDGNHNTYDVPEWFLQYNYKYAL